jgi:hypothetical protein
MQTLTPTVFPCYAPADRQTAAALAAMLEGVGDARVFLDEGEMRPGEDLASKAREARMADVALALFSHASLPPRWGRAQWEDALVKEPAAEGVRIGFVTCDDCIPPRVLAPRFDGRTVEGRRELKRWIRTRGYVPRAAAAATEQSADLGILGIALADRAGVETVAEASLAFEFASAFREDFDEVLRLQCGERTRTALAGELAARLGLRLEGDAESAIERLRQFCAGRRFLLLLDDARTPAARELAVGGRCSTLYCLEAGPAEAMEPDSLRAAQAAWTAKSGEWAELCRLARLGRRVAREQGRIAELHELMELWKAEAERREDRSAQEESTREMVWILDAWGRFEEARRLEYRRAMEFDEQLLLPLGDF